MTMIGKVRRTFHRQNKSAREIARLTSLSRSTISKYIVSVAVGKIRKRWNQTNRNAYFIRSSNCSGIEVGEWESLPDSGPLEEMAQLVVTLLQPYLQPDNY
jgi:hypothetical protein